MQKVLRLRTILPKSFKVEYSTKRDLREKLDQQNEEKTSSKKEGDEEKLNSKVIGKGRRLIPRKNIAPLIFKPLIKEKKVLDIPPTLCSHLLVVPLARRPFFPGFYKSLVIEDERVIRAIDELIQNGAPYIGIFMSENESEIDYIEDKSACKNVGVFAKITNFYRTERGITIIVFPYRRIKLNDISVPNDDSKPLDICKNEGI
jgi:Lon-like ATP-dependent protease